MTYRTPQYCSVQIPRSCSDQYTITNPYDGTVRGRCARLGNWRTHLGKDLAQNGNQRCQQQYVGKDDEYEHELFLSISSGLST